MAQARRLYQAAYRTELEDDITSDASPVTDQNATEGQNLSPEEVTWKQRYADLRRHNNSITDRVKELENQLAAANRKEIKMPSSPEELNDFAKRYPDVFRNIRSIVLTELMQEKEVITQETKVLKDDLENVKRERGFQKILKAHPDFEQINMSEDFHEWARVQPKNIQDWLFEESDPDLCIRGLDLYKADKGLNKPKEPPRKQTPRADLQVNTRNSVDVGEDNTNKRIWKASEIGRLKGKEYDLLEDEIMAARLEGRIDLNA